MNIDPERTLILATRGRDAIVAREILREAQLKADICADVGALVRELRRGAELAIVTEAQWGVPPRHVVPRA